MKRLLLIGLGNPLMGDEGVGWHVAERLAADPRLPDHVEAIRGGTDVLRYAGEMEGRSRVVLVDAIQDGAGAGSVTVFDPDLGGWEDHQPHAHHLSAIQAVGLLRLTVAASFTVIGISISSARFEPGLSPELAERMPSILQRVIGNLD